eukprot:664427-Prymnesium_polylepis.2
MIRLQHRDDQPPRDALQKCKTKLEPVDLRQTRLAKHKSITNLKCRPKAEAKCLHVSRCETQIYG